MCAVTQNTDEIIINRVSILKIVFHTPSMLKKDLSSLLSGKSHVANWDLKRALEASVNFSCQIAEYIESLSEVQTAFTFLVAGQPSVAGPELQSLAY